MSNVKFSNSDRVRIVADKNLLSTELDNSDGIILCNKDLLLNVMIISGKHIGKTHRFLSSQLEKSN